MFILLLIAKITFLASMLLQSTGWVYITQKSPWLVGNVVCSLQDVIIIVQYYLYGCGEPEEEKDGVQKMRV